MERNIIVKFHKSRNAPDRLLKMTTEGEAPTGVISLHVERNKNSYDCVRAYEEEPGIYHELAPDPISSGYASILLALMRGGILPDFKLPISDIKSFRDKPDDGFLDIRVIEGQLEVKLRREFIKYSIGLTEVVAAG